MMYRDEGGPAFPFGQISEKTGQPINGYFNEGMTLRDYFAAKAMQSILTSCYEDTPEHDEVSVATLAYAIADAMLAERKKGESE